MKNANENFPPLTNTEKDLCLEHWAECYVNMVGGDPHGEFANRLGVTRDDAKRIAFSWTYYQKSFFLLLWKKDNRIKAHLANQIRKMMKKAGKDVSVYEILQNAEETLENKPKGNK